MKKVNRLNFPKRLSTFKLLEGFYAVTQSHNEQWSTDFHDRKAKDHSHTDDINYFNSVT